MSFVDIYGTGAAAARAVAVMKFLNQPLHFRTGNLAGKDQKVTRLLALLIAVTASGVGLAAEENEGIAIRTGGHKSKDQSV